jgi:hypothetical protein
VWDSLIEMGNSLIEVWDSLIEMGILTLNF